MFESLSIGGDPVGFRMIANEFALNATTNPTGGIVAGVYNSSKANLARQCFSQVPRPVDDKPPSPWPKAVTEDELLYSLFVL